jgi:hypothetical protein
MDIADYCDSAVDAMTGCGLVLQSSLWLIVLSRLLFPFWFAVCFFTGATIASCSVIST